jgi:uncharacterized protein (DUF1499 family)
MSPGTTIGVVDGVLQPCGRTPNGVCSDSPPGRGYVEPLQITGDPAAFWAALCDHVAAMPRTDVVTRTDDYLHARCRSRVCRFVDDLELHARPAAGMVAVRSAARLGYYDFGVNRRRIAAVRVWADPDAPPPPSLLRLIWCLGLAAVLALTAVTAAAVTFLQHHHAAPLEVRCGGDAAALGTALGSEFDREIRWLLRFYVDTVLCHGKSELITERRAAAIAILDTMPPEYATELRAMAVASGSDPAALAYANAFLDMGDARAGCRSVVAQTDSGLLHCHNLDWENLGGLAKWTTAIVRREPDDGRFATVALGFPGMVGALDIINEHGVALSFNQLGYGNRVPVEPVFVSMRRIAERCRTFAEAEHEIRSLQPGMAFILTLSSAGEGRAAIFERIGTTVTRRDPAAGWVAATNAVQATEPGLTKLDQCLAATTIRDSADLQHVLADSRVLMDCNLYSVIFDYTGNRLLLASGRVPAAPIGYREFVLFTTRAAGTQ